ncbi:uncharacterized protein K489DRAFT_177339 [Dissoconium aciculare CBS 342.82]|uniref:F-box domain-containing protein n=1 Tax=Dissoconium aciculare CBS 342.82 TaxID=1314786 RepID=A0A6J3M9C4_9PEZI|nr:uncharacterized protein K489DRAFT_177339 [Dissoconium aciculare CBS 342.82]KAF1824219.1 hypothetical protein K489DRAFT_177339 [Dissoconium aciculare CBS 342.82]
MGARPRSLHLLELPYDIRHLIYQHLFPPEAQIYIQVDLRSSLCHRLAPPEQHEFPTSLLRASRQLHEEASAYLHSIYVFNIIGTKQDCLIVYENFLNMMRRHARPGCEPCATAFSNGPHSSTMCISLHSGAGATAMVRRRQRGKQMRIEDVRREVQKEANLYHGSSQWLRTCLHDVRLGTATIFWILSALVTVVALAFASSAAYAH